MSKESELLIELTAIMKEQEALEHANEMLDSSNDSISILNHGTNGTKLAGILASVNGLSR